MTYNIANIGLYSAPILSGIAQGYNTELPLVGAMIAPIVDVNSLSGSIVRFGKESFAVEDTARGYGNPSKIVSSKFGLDSYTLQAHTLGYQIPVEILENEGACACGPQALDLRKIEIANVIQKLALGHEVEVTTLATTAGTYETTNYFAGVTTAPGNAGQWGSATSTPIADVLRLQSVTRKAVGARFNSIVLGSATYERLQSHPDIIGRIVYNSGNPVDTAALATYFGVASVIVADAIRLDPITGQLVSVFPENGFLGFYSSVPGKAAYNMSGNAMLKAVPSSFYTYQMKGGVTVAPEKLYDLTDPGTAANVVRSVAQVQRQVLPVGLGNTGKVSSAVYINNVFA